MERYSSSWVCPEGSATSSSSTRRARHRHPAGRRAAPGRFGRPTRRALAARPARPALPGRLAPRPGAARRGRRVVSEPIDKSARGIARADRPRRTTPGAAARRRCSGRKRPTSRAFDPSLFTIDLPAMLQRLVPDRALLRATSPTRWHSHLHLPDVLPASAPRRRPSTGGGQLPTGRLRAARAGSSRSPTTSAPWRGWCKRSPTRGSSCSATTPSSCSCHRVGRPLRPATDAYEVADGAIDHLVLASACDHSVIANSSFAWWGAWLGERRAGLRRGWSSLPTAYAARFGQRRRARPLAARVERLTPHSGCVEHRRDRLLDAVAQRDGGLEAERGCARPRCRGDGAVGRWGGPAPTRSGR